MVREKPDPASRRRSRRGRRARRARARLGAALSLLAVAPPLLAGTACGGRVLILVPYGDDGGAPGPAPDDASASASGSGGGRSGSSSSGGTSYVGSSGATASPDGGPGSSGGGGTFVGNAICASAADCPSGLVCCATQNLVTSCLKGPCPAEAPLQFCATATECVVKTDTCIFLLTEPEDSYMVCTPRN